MLMKMLEAGGVEILTDQVREADEDNPRGYYELERVKALDKSDNKDWVKRGRCKAVKVISQLLPELPEDSFYQVIFMNRDLDEVIASQNKMLARRGEAVNTDDNERMKELFSNHLKRIRMWLEEQPNFQVLYVEHRSCIAEPFNQSRRMKEFLKRDMDTEKMASVVDPALYRNRMSRPAS
jgi:hypothetical protein